MGALRGLPGGGDPVPARRGPAADPATIATRLRLFSLVAAIAFAVLALRLWHIQFVRGLELREQAVANRFAAREIPADRGVIYDRAGNQVVFNQPHFTVSIVPAALPGDPAERRRVLARVADAVDLPLEPPAARAPGEAGPTEPRRSLWSYLVDADGAFVPTWSAIPIPRTVPRQAAFDLMEEAVDLPGVIIGESSVREYRAGPTLAHLLGFTGSIPEDEVTDYRALGYRLYDIVGRAGLEYSYEAALRGRKGEKIVQVDAMGRELGEVPLAEPREPQPGMALKLTVDLAFQRQVEEALQRGLNQIGARSGAVVALDPRDGAVRALVSLPVYDNNMFATGASPAEFADLLSDPGKPLINRAIAGQYAPGSTYKMITASAALQEGVVSPETRISDPGMIHLVNQYDPGIRYPFRCWRAGGHGSVNVVGALAHSCDVYFYEVSGGNAPGRPEIRGLGSAGLIRYARLFGLGAPTGIDLLGEAAGLVPSPDWLEETLGEYWGTGITYQTGIGQGYTLVTPLQQANVTAAVANGGTLFRPHLVESLRDAEGGEVAPGAIPGDLLTPPGGVLRRLPIDPGHLALVRQGMAAAVRSGTAQSAWTRLPTEIGVAGKTGTAEFCDPVVLENGGTDCRRDREGHLLTHAWFVAFAPVEQPEIALAVFVDGSGLDRIIEGSREAAPIAAEVLRAYFKLPPPRLPTPPSPTPCPNCPAPSPTAPPAEGG